MVGSRELPLKEYRRQVQMVFQDSYSSLNPRLTIEDSHRLRPPGARRAGPSRCERAHDLLARVGLDPGALRGRYPHELSGGQRQRVNIARALALQPRLIILDEAVSALDKSVEAQVLNLLLDLKAEFGLTYVFISHDLNVVRFVSDRVMVMYLGKVAESAGAEALYSDPLHPYSQALLSSMPAMDPDDRTDGGAAERRSAQPDRSAAGLPLPHPLSHGSPGLRPGRAGPGAARARHAGGLPRARPRLGPWPAARGGRGMTAPPVRIEQSRRHLHRRLRPVRAVNDASLDVAAGEAVALIGESGSGKSVTMRAVMRLNPEKKPPLEGRIWLAGAT
jgi:ABC-type glutathione transport system ATPase component